MHRPAVTQLHEHHSAATFATQYLPTARQHNVDATAPFQLHRVEDVAPLLQVPTAPHRTSFHYLLFLTQGHGENTRGVQTVALGPDTVLLLPAGQVTATNAISTDVRGYFCLFEPDFLAATLPAAALLPELSFFTLGERPTLALPPADSRRLATLLETLRGEWRAGAPPALLGALLYAVLLTIRQHYEQAEATARTGGGGAEQLARRFLALLAREPLRFLTVAAFSDHLAVTPNHLTRCVRWVTGRAASAWISRTRALEAQVRLRDPQLTVAEVAEQLGFPDVSYFGRFFRQHTGLTPSAYRRQA